MKTIITSAVLLLMVTGCNTTNEETNNFQNTNINEGQVAQVNSSADGGGAICRQEKTIGSNVRRTVCRTRAQIEDEKQEAELAQRDMRRQSGGDINSALKRGTGK